MQKSQQKPRHLLSLKDYDGKWMKGIVDLGIKIKKSMRDPETGGIDSRRYLDSKYRNVLAGKCLVAVFEKPSLRTAISFSQGMPLLGGISTVRDVSSMHTGSAEVLAEIKSTGRFADIIMIRPLKHATAELYARWSGRPVIDGCSESDHPCQALADIMTIMEKFGTLKGVKVVYLGIANNVSNSLMLACTKSGATFVMCAPPHAEGMDDLDLQALRQAQETGLFTWETDVAKAVKGACILYTDTWVNMEHQKDKTLMAERKKLMLPYQLNKKVMDTTPRAFSMHDLPAHWNPETKEYLEIDEYALHGPRSIAFDQAENRRWAQMAVMLNLIGEKK